MFETTEMLKEQIIEPHPDQQLINAIREIEESNKELSYILSVARSQIETSAFKYSSPEARKTFLDQLAAHAGKQDDMIKAVIKGIRKIKRIRLRDDDTITALVQFWAQNGGGPIG